MSVVARTLQAQRRIIAVMLVLTALAFWRGAFSVFSMVKGTVILLAVVGLLVASAVRIAQTRRAFVPVGLPVWLLAGFAAALVLSTLASPNILGSLAGQGGRFTGLVMYGAYALLFLVLIAYEPFRRRDGEVAVLLMLCYAVHRFLNEMLPFNEKAVLVTAAFFGM
jgi:hypothetical protein